MNVSLRQLRAFVEVARTGSFTQAAAGLHVTQSALSGLIKELEEILGLRVLDRTTRRIQLSKAGADLYPLVEAILQDLDHALTEVGKLKSLKGGTVRVAAPQLLASAVLPQVIAAYRELHPGIHIKLVDCVLEGVVSRVFSGEVDLGIGPEREPNSDIVATPLFNGPFMAVFPPGHALAALPRVSWAELLRYPLISLQGQFTERLALDLRAVSPEIDLTPTSEVVYMSTALAMVKAGFGVTACILYAEPLVRLYNLIITPLVEPVISRRFFVYTRKGRAASPAVQSFSDFLFAYVAEHPSMFTLSQTPPMRGQRAARGKAGPR